MLWENTVISWHVLTVRVEAERVVLPAGEAHPGGGGVLEAGQFLRGEARVLSSWETRERDGVR